MKTKRKIFKIDNLKRRYTKRKPKMGEDTLDGHFYYDIEDIIHQSGAGYSIKKSESSRYKTDKLLNKLVKLGWRREYLEKTFQNMNDTLIQNWSDNLLIENLFKYIIQQYGYIGSINKSFITLGLNEDVSNTLEDILTPLLDSSYSCTQILDKGIEYLLGSYKPIAQPDTTHYIKPDSINIWFKYHGADSKPIQVYNIPYSVKDGLQQFDRALSTIPNTIDSNINYYFHTTSWEGSRSILKHINRLNGRTCLDFGIFPGFYLAENHLDSVDWGLKNTKIWSNEVAILIFALPNTLPKNIKYKELKDEEWIRVTKESRECKQKKVEIDTIRKYDLLYGDMVYNVNNVIKYNETPVPHNPPKKQLTGRTDNSEKFLHKCLVGCVYFQKYTE